MRGGAQLLAHVLSFADDGARADGPALAAALGRGLARRAIAVDVRLALAQAQGQGQGQGLVEGWARAQQLLLPRAARGGGGRPPRAVPGGGGGAGARGVPQRPASAET